jgi:hypothetical protein
MATASAARAAKGSSQAPARSARPCSAAASRSCAGVNAGGSTELEKFACGQPKERPHDRLFRRTENRRGAHGSISRRKATALFRPTAPAEPGSCSRGRRRRYSR